MRICPSALDFYGNPFLFTGRFWDAHIDKYHYRARAYDPELGRFMSRDPVGVWGDQANLGNPYAYVGNNPSTHRDPFGLYGTAEQCVAAAHGGSCSYNAGGDIVAQHQAAVPDSCYNGPLGGGFGRADCGGQREAALRTGDLAVGAAVGAGEAAQAAGSALTFGAIPTPNLCDGSDASRYHREGTGAFGECYGTGLTFAAGAVAGAAAAPAALTAVSRAAAAVPTRAYAGCGIGLGIEGVSSGFEYTGLSATGSCAGGALAGGLYRGLAAGGTAARAVSGLGAGAAGGFMQQIVEQGGNRLASGGTCTFDPYAFAGTIGIHAFTGGVARAASPALTGIPSYAREVYPSITTTKASLLTLPAATQVTGPAGTNSCAI